MRGKAHTRATWPAVAADLDSCCLTCVFIHVPPSPLEYGVRTSHFLKGLVKGSYPFLRPFRRDCYPFSIKAFVGSALKGNMGRIGIGGLG